MQYDVIVIGAGASGLMAAGTAARQGARVLLIEKMERPGRKVRITGKGRCNVTNLRPAGEFMEHIRAGRELFATAFAAFDNEATARFFEEIGVKMVRERGERLFPESGRAEDVARALEAWCDGAGVEKLFRTRVTKILAGNGSVAGVATSAGEFSARSVILCTGGVSYPATGSTGDGYKMAHELGHAIEPLQPSLVSLYSDHQAMASLAGLALRNVSVSLYINGKCEASEFGEMEFARSRTTRRGVELAGAVVLRLSRRAVGTLLDGQRTEISIDLKPALDIPTLSARITREVASLGQRVRLGDVLRKLMPESLVAAIAREMGHATATPMHRAPSSEDIARAVKDFRLPLSGHAPFEEAIVTAGGIAAEGVNPTTLLSRRVRGLYFAGEVLDIDADTGGYNLQIAFSTGHLAGTNAAGK